jgi:hypothetical protein
MRLNKPVYFDDENDREILEWLSKKNYSSFMRELAYEKFNQLDILKVVSNMQIQNQSKGDKKENKATEKLKQSFLKKK